MVDYNTKWINICNINLIKNKQIELNSKNTIIINTNKKDDKFDINKIIYNINKININNLNSIELLQLESNISININKYYFSYNNNKISIILELLNKLLKICKILKNKLNLKTLKIKNDLITKNSIPRSSYKFCVHKDACKFNYDKNNNHGCYSHHYVHNLLEYDIQTIIYYIQTYVNKDNFNNNQEIIKSFTTINYVIKHMYEELYNIKLYVKDSENIEKYHFVNIKKTNKKLRKPIF
jgi:hypothetical protein